MTGIYLPPHAETNVGTAMSTETPPHYHHHLPPYGKPGPPYVLSKHTLLYDPMPSIHTPTTTTTTASSLSTSSRWTWFQQQRLSEQLRKCFPLIYVLTHGASLVLNSVIQIILQIVLMSTNGSLWFVAGGIWTGAFMLLTAASALLLAFNRKYWTFIVSYVLHLIAVLMAIGGYLVVNVIAISEYTPLCSYFPNCFNENVKVLNYIMFWLGVVCIILLLVYIVLMPCYIMDILNLHSKYKSESVAQIQQPNSLLRHSTMYSQNELIDNYDVKIDPTARNVHHNFIYEYPIVMVENHNV